jgi:hypothetical protein
LPLGALLVTLGVAAEFAFQVRTSVLISSIRGIQHDRDSLQRTQIAASTERAASAEKEAAAAKLELAKYREPRRINPFQRLSIVDRLKLFPGTTFDTAFGNGDAEQADFLWLLEDAIRASGWLQIDWKGGDIVVTRTDRPLAGIVSAANVVLQMHPDKVPELWEAAIALASVLNNEGFATRAERALGAINNNKDAMHIMIGRKQ